MGLKKTVVALTLVAFLGSDFAFGIAPALGQSPGTGNGHVPMPSLNGDGVFGRVFPGPSTPTPYQAGPQQPQAQPQQFPTPRLIAPATPNVCQPGGGTRALQTAAAPRSRALEAVPNLLQTGVPTVTQVTVTQGAPSQVSQSPTAPQPAAAHVALPEPEDLSRVEAAFNVDPIRQFAVPIGLNQPASAQQPGALQVAVQPVGQQQPSSGQQQVQPSAQQLLQQPTQGQAMLGPFGAPLRQYGYSMFSASVSTFAPVDDIPVGPDYVLGPGDDVTINVWGAVDSTLVRTVDRNGRIVLPKVGDLRIW